MKADENVAMRGRVVTPDGVIERGAVWVEAGRIAEVRAADGNEDAESAWILPGFVDLHVHGGGGHTFTTADPAEARRAAAFHARHGTTTMLASLVSDPYESLSAATSAFAPLIADATLAGIHYEGPFLSPARCGAQNPAHLRQPNLEELAALLDLGQRGEPGVRMMTVAPELPQALAAIRMLVTHGAVAAIGHTDATYEQTVAALDAGASLGTHVCNAMRPMHHRDPGPIVALLDHPNAVCEQIPDGVHLHDGMLRHVLQAAGADRIALVTDATAAAGMPDGAYALGGQAVEVRDGVARLTHDGSIAGSTLTMDAALRHVVHSGVDLVRAARMASTTPAKVLGRSDEIGRIAVGLRADLVLLDEELRVLKVLRGGQPYPL
jgi:N-acetylglucosamine-6-phosphate deacetylase